MPEKMHPLLLKNVPLEIRKYLLKVQSEIKIQKGVNQYSLEQTIYKIIRDQIK